MGCAPDVPALKCRLNSYTLTLGYCQFLELRRDDFQQLLKTEPEVTEEMRRVAEARLHNDQLSSRGLGWKALAPYNQTSGGLSYVNFTSAGQ
jgi:hypothetical protein